jgi:putative transposase
MATTSVEKDLNPYWSAYSAAMSSRLWLPTKTVLQSLGSESSTFSSRKTVEKSWFATELHTAPKEILSKICSPTFTSSPAECTDLDDTLVKSKKIRVYPTPEQLPLFRQWIGTARRAYNQTVALLKQPGTKANWKKIKTDLIDALPEWADPVPYQIKSIAIRDACKAVSAAKRKFKITGEFQEVHFRKRKNPVQSCFIPKDALSKKGVYHTLAGELKLEEALPDERLDSRLVCHNERWYLAVPYKTKRQGSDNQGRVVALDPGIRSFQSFFSEDSCGKLGSGDFGRIQRLCAHLDKRIGQLKTEKRRLRCRRLKSSCARLRSRVRNLIDELHHKVTLFLVKSFDVILLPTFETKQMTSRQARKLTRKSVRSMLTFSHYRFKQFLKYKAFEYGKTVIDVNEAWTSKTVSWTGEINKRLGGAKQITSRLTGDTMDRDYNGARGIFLRVLGDHPILNACVQDVSALSAT